ncbi:MAG: metallophosphoesterase [Thermoproteota archaeon]
MEFKEVVEKYDGFDVEEIIENCEKALEKLAEEPALLDFNCENVLIVGDLHGDLESCLKAIRLAEELGYSRIIFLGDYVDRGRYQLGVINLLLNEKAKNPSRIVLLRGNHETPFMNFSYGFVELLIERFKESYERVYNAYLKVFSEMPIAAVVNKKLILVHGGLASKVRKLSDLIDSNKGGIDLEDPRVFETLWNDPSEEIEEFSPNIRGPGIYYFGKTALKRFLEENGLKMMIRSHEPGPNGYRIMFNGLLVSVFSCRFYGIRPAAIRLEGEKYAFQSLE